MVWVLSCFWIFSMLTARAANNHCFNHWLLFLVNQLIKFNNIFKFPALYLKKKKMNDFKLTGQRSAQTGYCVDIPDLWGRIHTRKFFGSEQKWTFFFVIWCCLYSHCTFFLYISYVGCDLYAGAQIHPIVIEEHSLRKIVGLCDE